MNDNWIAQAVRTHVLDGPSQSELTRSDMAPQAVAKTVAAHGRLHRGSQEVRMAAAIPTV